MAITADSSEKRALPRTLAGATVLQIVTALRDSSQARTTVSAARALVQVGARAIVAGERGDLVDELKRSGEASRQRRRARQIPRRRARRHRARQERRRRLERVDRHRPQRRAPDH
jgi:hypothetical protein